MKNVRVRWLTLPSGRVLGVNVLESALSPEALRMECGLFVSISTLPIADRAAVWAVYAAERQALDEMLDARANWQPAAGV